MDEEKPKPESWRQRVPPSHRPPTAVGAAMQPPGQPLPRLTLRLTLRDLLAASGTLAIGDALAVAIAIASALAFHHRKGLVHGDIKPSNVYFPGERVEVEISQDCSRSDEVFWTPMYASPEQIEGRAFDLRTDVYSLGVVVYEMLVGSAPFTANNVSELLVQKRRDPPPPIPHVPRELELAVHRAMAQHAIDRFQNMPEFAQALSAIEVNPQRGLIARVAGWLRGELTRLQRRRGPASA